MAPRRRDPVVGCTVSIAGVGVAIKWGSFVSPSICHSKPRLIGRGVLLQQHDPHRNLRRVIVERALAQQPDAAAERGAVGSGRGGRESAEHSRARATQVRGARRRHARVEAGSTQRDPRPARLRILVRSRSASERPSTARAHADAIGRVCVHVFRLVGAQRHGGIRTNGGARRHGTRRRGDARQHAGRDGQGHRIPWRHAVELPAQPPRTAGRAHQADQQASAGQRYALPNDQSDDVEGVRAERKPNPKFSPALNDAWGHALRANRSSTTTTGA